MKKENKLHTMHHYKNNKKREPKEWKTNFIIIKKMIEKYKLSDKEINLLAELYQGYLYSWMKGYSVDYQEFMADEAEKLRRLK